MIPHRILLVLAILALPGVVYAAAVDVTVSASKSTIGIGETATLSVFGQLKPGYAAAGNGIFGWDVDLRVADPTIVGLDPATLLRPGEPPRVDAKVWTSNALTSSHGTAKPWGVNAVYDTGEDRADLGLSSRVELFSIQFTGLALGTSTLTVEPDITTGADFVTWLGNTGGDYSGASQGITVTPEPATISLLGLGILALLHRRKR